MSSFTPVQAVNMLKEKDWPAALGMLDWDSTRIVFTKRSLIEFLKYTGTTVDPNLTNIGKLPRYATFGKISDVSTDGPQTTVADSKNDAEVADEFKPTRRVRTVPGGHHTDIFGYEDQDDALNTAPPKEPQAGISPAATSSIATASEETEESGLDFGPRFKPTRRVRTNPGGNSSMASLWDPEKETEDFKPTRRVRQGPGGHDNLWDNAEPDQFKPTRRVRQGPGGQDNITGIF